MEETDNMNTHNNNKEITHEQQENYTITGVHENEQTTVQTMTTHQNMIQKTHTTTYRQHQRKKK